MRNDVAVVVLAGGEGRRIGGGKPLRIFAGERLIDRAVTLARSWSDRVAIAVRDRSQVGSVPVDLIYDEDVPGPLGGLISGLEFAARERREFLLAIPADMPFLPPDLLDRLGEAIGDRRCALAASGGQLHPVCGLWRAAAIDRAVSYTGAGRRSLKGFAELVGFVAVEWPNEPVDPFFNINTSDDLAEAARRNA
jgi:molybdopterin-guanine dinucleotide biosynthesis protein A